jgi:hypothetical protein
MSTNNQLFVLANDEYDLTNSDNEILNDVYQTLLDANFIECITFYEPNENEGFMWSQDEKLKKIFRIVGKKYNFSGSYTVCIIRTLSSILKYNYCINRYIDFLKENYAIDSFVKYVIKLSNDFFSAEIRDFFFHKVEQLRFAYIINNLNKFYENIHSKLNE